MKSNKKTYRAKSANPNKLKNIIEYPITPEEIYNLAMHKLEFGIEGYEVPRHYYDYHQAVWVKKREKILSAHKHVWPPENWPKDKDDENSKIPPKRKNYLDDLYKWCNSYYDPKRAEELISDKGINVKDYVKPLKIDKERRKKFLEEEKKKEEWFKSRPEYPKEKMDAYQAAADRKKEFEDGKEDPIEKIKKKYKDKPQTARCDRISVVADAQHVGEQLPFYNTFTKDGEEVDKNKLFFPSKRTTSGWRRAPAWNYPKPFDTNTSQKEKRLEDEKAKFEDYLNAKNIDKKDLNLQIRDAFHKVTHHGELLMRFDPVFEYKKEEHYDNYIKNNPKVYIGPQQYWKMPKETFTKNKTKKPNLSVITDDNGNKIYYMDRKRTDKRVYSAGMRKAVY